MGKIRVNTIGDEAAEQKQKIEAEKRREAKKSSAPKAMDDKIENSSTEASAKAEKVVKKKSTKKKARTARYVASKKFSDKTKVYAIADALDLLSQMQKAKFDETVELHINTNDKINGNITLPHGTGKQTKVAIFAPSQDAAAADALVKDIEAGKIDFDVLIATPDAMPKLAKVARFLGPRGLMPNPKNGTVTPKPEEVAKKFAGGQMNYKTEAKANIVHVAVGKVSFGKEKLSENIKAFMGAMDSTKVTSVFVKTTMSPSIKLSR